MTVDLSLAELLALVYGDNEALTDEVRGRIRDALGKDVVQSIADVRAVTMALDRQQFPTPLLVRFGPGDVHFARINGIECPVDRHDISVCVPAAAMGSWEPHLVACFRRVCRAGDVALDIGANVGYHTLLLATLVGERGRCVAFEPNSENCRLILLGVEHNQLTNVQVVPLALADEPGWGYFSTHIGSNGGLVTTQFVAMHGHGVVVPVSTLDAFGLPEANVIKIDVEGAEYRCLKGGKTLIERSRPLIVNEFSHEMTQRVSGVSPLEFLDWICGMDYVVHLLDRFSCEIVAVDVRRDLIDNWGDHVRIEDLLFVPREKLALLG
jgi:FkbM family methyltransferase